MRRYLLDAGPLAAYLAGRGSAVAMIRPWIQRKEAATSIPVYGEVDEHLRSQTNFRQQKAVLQHLLVNVYPFALAVRPSSDIVRFAGAFGLPMAPD